jgi:hypothetical protein
VFENHVKSVMVDDQEVDLSLWDTAGELKSSTLFIYSFIFSIVSVSRIIYIRFGIISF